VLLLLAMRASRFPLAHNSSAQCSDAISPSDKVDNVQPQISLTSLEATSNQVRDLLRKIPAEAQVANKTSNTKV